MNWLTNFIRPKIQSFVQQKEMPDDLWQKCPACEGMLFHRDLADAYHVCYHCGHHMKIGVEERLKLIFDNGKYKTIAAPKTPQDPLKFKDRKKYADRLRDSRQKTGRDDAIIIAKGQCSGMPLVTAAFDFAFMGGSMGTAVGEGILAAAESAVKEKAALLVIPASGGARMQEGALSLMQMPRTIIAAEKVKTAGLPYLVLLTDPTTGGVSASFAMVGDIHLAEPGCTIGFAGKRVIKETVGEDLPDDFQTAEYLCEHGMVDMVVPRPQLAETLGRILSLLQQKEAPHKPGDKGPPERPGNGKKSAGAPARSDANKDSGKTVRPPPSPRAQIKANAVKKATAANANSKASNARKAAKA